MCARAVSARRTPWSSPSPLMKTQHKTQLLASVYCTFYLAKLLIFVTRKGPSTHVIDATSFVKMCQQEKKRESHQLHATASVSTTVACPARHCHCWLLTSLEMVAIVTTVSLQRKRRQVAMEAHEIFLTVSSRHQKRFRLLLLSLERAPPPKTVGRVICA